MYMTCKYVSFSYVCDFAHFFQLDLFSLKYNFLIYISDLNGKERGADAGTCMCFPAVCGKRHLTTSIIMVQG